jgi:transcriptional regulator with XRE-family HTH domain
MTLLQHYRERAGLSIVELAQKTGIAHSTIWKIEHGQRKLHIHEVKPLASVLGCSPEALLPDLPSEAPAHV